VTADACSTLAGALLGARREIAGRPDERPSRFPDAGMTILRTEAAHSPEIWCRCDGGPHGFLSIAAHAHADALSVEVRYGGVDILADPGTYCYHGEPEWRSYFRSTIGHNTVQIDGSNQSVDGGPFMWLRQARTWELPVPERTRQWSAEHDGYTSLKPSVRHRRLVCLEPETGLVEITDVISGRGNNVRLAFHLGPDVAAALDGEVAILSWGSAETPGSARLELPTQLRWSLHRAETSPILGWYSPVLGVRVPAYTLLGSGQLAYEVPLKTRLHFIETEKMVAHSPTGQVVSLGVPCPAPTDAPGSQVEAR
jgi:hypothetical protein